MHNPSSDSSYWNMLFYCYHSEAHKNHINAIFKPNKRSQPQATAEPDVSCITGDFGVLSCFGMANDRCSAVLFYMMRLQRSICTNVGIYGTDTLVLTQWEGTEIIVAVFIKPTWNKQTKKKTTIYNQLSQYHSNLILNK